MDTRSTCTRTLAVLVTLLAAGTADANGFFIPQQSVQVFGRATAGSAAGADDASTIFYNPAGLPRLYDDPRSHERRLRISGGLNLIYPHLEFTDRGTTVATPGTAGAPVPVGGASSERPGKLHALPNFFTTYSFVNGNVIVGLGVTAPFGLATEYDRAWFGRYDSIKSKLTTINMAPTLAVKVNSWLSVGAGIDIQYADAELSSALPNTLLPGGPTPATDGLFELAGDDLSTGFNVGALVSRPGWRLGVHYRSAMSHDLDGRATTGGLTGPLAALNGSTGGATTLDLPAILSVGAAWEPAPRWTLLAGYTWFGWSDFEEVRVRFDSGAPDFVRRQEYRNSHAVALGLEHALLPGRLAVRGGIQYNTTPTVDRLRSTTLPDAPSTLFAVGATWTPGNWFGNAEVDLLLGWSVYRTSRLNLTEGVLAGPAAGTLVVRGASDLDVFTASLNVRMQF